MQNGNYRFGFFQRIRRVTFRKATTTAEFAGFVATDLLALPSPFVRMNLSSRPPLLSPLHFYEPIGGHAMLRSLLYVLCFAGAVLAFKLAEYISFTPGYEAICCLFFACSFSTVSDLSVALHKDIQAIGAAYRRDRGG